MSHAWPAAVARAVAALGMLTPLSAQASWFEFCDLAGEVRAVSQDAPGSVYRLTVKVAAAARAKDQGEDSYIDCSEYLDTDLKVLLRFPEPVTIPRPGDRVAFNRVVVEVIDTDTHGSELRAVTTLQSHEPAPTAAGIPAGEPNRSESRIP